MPHLRKVRVKHLVAQQTAYTLRIRMPCSRTDGCNGCVIAQDMSVDRGSTRTGLVLVWNERRHQCALLVERLNPPAPPSTGAAQAIDPPGTVTPVGTPVPQTVTARQAAVADTMAVRTEAEGLRLHLSSRNSNGYWGVHRQGGRFVAQQWLGGKNVCLGVFGTAVEAAVAYARAVGEYQPPAVATEAEGLRLHLSSRNRTGYKGVHIHKWLMASAERMDAPPRVLLGLPFFAQVGRNVLGSYATAVEAAVAYARAVGEYTPPPPPPAAAEPAAAPAAAEPTTQIPVTQAPVAAEAEGVRLHLSSRSSTGYLGVRKSYAGRFRAEHRAGGKRDYLGSYATAVEAAVAYARAPGPAEVAAAAAAAAEPRAAQAHERARAVAQERARAVEAACGAARAGCPVRDTSTTRPGHPPIGSQGDARRQG